VSYLNSPRKRCPRGMTICVWTHLSLIKWKTTSKKIRNGRRPKKIKKWKTTRNKIMENNLKNKFNKNWRQTLGENKIYLQHIHYTIFDPPQWLRQDSNLKSPHSKYGALSIRPHRLNCTWYLFSPLMGSRVWITTHVHNLFETIKQLCEDDIHFIL
jgi:hypothetical protein